MIFKLLERGGVSFTSCNFYNIQKGQVAREEVMKRKVVRWVFLLCASILLTAGGAMADGYPYWTLTDLTTGTDGTANFSVTFDNASNSNITFGIFNTTDPSNTAIDTLIPIFEPGTAVGYTAAVEFTWDGTEYDVVVSLRDNTGNLVQPSDSYDGFGAEFGFYFYREADGGRWIFSDPAFNNNEGDNSMDMVADLDNELVFLQLYYGEELKYVVQAADVAPVPEPATMLLLGSGLAGIAGWRRRKK